MRHPAFAKPRLRLTAGNFLAIFVVGAVVAVPGAVLPQWREGFASPGQIALYFNLILLGLLVGVTAGSRSRSRRLQYPLAPVSVAVGFTLAALAPTFNGVLAAAVLIGFGQGIINVHGNGLTGELWPERRVAMLNWVNAAFGVGAVSAPILSLWLPWREMFGLFAALALVTAFLVWNAPGPVRTQAGEGRGSGSIWLALLIIVCYAGLEGSLATYSGVYLELLGYPPTLTGTLLSLYWAGLTAGRLFLGTWVALAPLRYLTFLITGSVATLLLMLIPTLAPIFPLVGLFYGPIFATVFALVQEKFGYRAIGGVFYAGAVGGTLGPAFFALVSPPLIPYGFLTVAILLLATVNYLRRVDARPTV